MLALRHPDSAAEPEKPVYERLPGTPVTWEHFWQIAQNRDKKKHTGGNQMMKKRFLSAVLSLTMIVAMFTMANPFGGAKKLMAKDEPIVDPTIIIEGVEIGEDEVPL